MNTRSEEVVIVNEFGLHARSAALISKIAQKAASNVWITKDGNRVDASSVVDILTLACEKGSLITIEIDDPSDTNILYKIHRLIESGFGEDVK
jgi:phosphocarrier protein